MEMITILVLEDDPKFSEKIVQLLKRQLTERAGIECRVLVATTLRQALDHKSKQKIDIHLIDIDLPGREKGFDYLSEVGKDFDHDEPTLPVIIMSHHEDDRYQIKSYKFKTIGYIEKSIYSDDLALEYLERAVKLMRSLRKETVTFVRYSEQRTYKEENVWTIRRAPNGQKKMIVTIYNEDWQNVMTEEFTLKTSLEKVPEMFSSPVSMVRCHKQHLVNPSAVVGRNSDHLLLPLGIKVPIGAEYEDNFSD